MSTFRCDGSTEKRERAALVFVTGWKPRESLPAPVAEIIPMASAVPKIVLSSSRDIPFNKLVLSQSNVRRVKAGVSIEELAEDIARRTLLQSLSVRPVLDADGEETGMFEVPAGGRRFRALELLVKQKRLAKTALVPCVVRDPGADISAEEDSLAENAHRADLHPLDQFRAFKMLSDQGLAEEDIAARFFVTPAVVKQRLRLAAVSPRAARRLCRGRHDAAAAHGLHGHQRPCAPGAGLGGARPRLQQGAHSTSAVSSPRARCKPSDRRALFVGVEAYEAAGGISCATCSKTMMAAGCRIPRCSTAWSPRNWSAKPKVSAPKAGSGSPSRSTSRTATPTAFAG